MIATAMFTYRVTLTTTEATTSRSSTTTLSCIVPLIFFTRITICEPIEVQLKRYWSSISYYS
jgi:hypothetical protein